MHIARATLVSTIVASAVVAFLAFLMRPTPDWGTDDSGAVQGYAYFVLACSAAVVSSALVFPLVALRLQRNGTFTRSRWTRHVLLGVVMVAFACSAAATLFLFGGSLLNVASILTLTVLLSILMILMLVPLSPMWLWIARAPKNRPNSSANVA